MDMANDPWMVYAHDTLAAAYADRATLHYGREIVIFSLSNKSGSGKILRINRVRIGCASIVTFTGVIGNFALYRVGGTISGQLEVIPTAMSKFNDVLPPQVRGFYTYNTAPLSIASNASINTTVATEWGILRRQCFIWDESVNNVFAAPTADEMTGSMTCYMDIVDFTDMKALDIQKITIREGESLVLAVSDMPADGAIRADVQIEFEVS